MPQVVQRTPFVSCQKCGAAMPATAQFCPQCGLNVNPTVAFTPPPAGRPPIRLLIWGIIAVLVAVAIVFSWISANTLETGPSSILVGVLSTVLLVIGLAFYFLPTIVAYDRKHQYPTAVFALNFFLGWTFVGWVIALVWAFVSDPQS